MRKILLSIVSVVLVFHSDFMCSSELNITKADDITYDVLTDAGINYVSIFKEIFGNSRVRTFLEFGYDYPTKYFLDSCHKVISVGMITHGYGPEPFKKYLALYRDCSNWIPLAYLSGYIGDPSWASFKYIGSESVYKAASYQCVTHKNYALMDDFYITELNAFIGNLVRYHAIDLAFVNMIGVVLRGDVVQCLLGKVPVIVAQDTSMRYGEEKSDLYGYTRVVTPDDYEEIYISKGGGTTVWIQKNNKWNELVQVLKNYANAS